MRKKALRPNDSNTFVQDDSKVTNRRTLNLEVRYENYLGWPWTEVDNRGYNFLPSTGALAQLETDRVPGSGMRANNLDFTPRIGIAHQANSRTVVSTAYGEGALFVKDKEVALRDVGRDALRRFSDASADHDDFPFPQEATESAELEIHLPPVLTALGTGGH